MSEGFNSILWGFVGGVFGGVAHALILLATVPAWCNNFCVKKAKIEHRRITLSMTDGADRLSALQEQNARLLLVLKMIDAAVPRADNSCDDPGITISEAVCRQIGIDSAALEDNKQDRAG